MKSVAVDCLFQEDGTIRVRRVRVEGTWAAIGQGRQWQDEEGRHVLIMLDGRDVWELLLNAGSLAWELKRIQASRSAVV